MNQTDIPTRSPHPLYELWRAWGRSKICPGDQLSPDQLEQIWACRVSILPLKPETDVDEDRRIVCEFFAKSRLTMRLYGADGSLQGVGAIKLRELHDGQQPYRWIETEYFALSEELRGSLTFSLAALKLCLEPIHWPLRPTYIGGPGYPTSLFFLSRTFPPLYMEGDADIPPQAQHLMDYIIAQYPEDWDPVHRRVKLRTKPKAPSPGWLKGATAHGFYPRFMARCPDWQEGYGVPCVVRWRLTPALSKMIKRWRQQNMGANKP